MSAPAAPRSVADLEAVVRRLWEGRVAHGTLEGGPGLSLECDPGLLREVCGFLARKVGLSFAGLVVEEGDERWALRYLFRGGPECAWVQVRTGSNLFDRIFPSISTVVHAADWHEREAEDLYGLVFDGHPRLGDFVLHDDEWEEAVEPMRRAFDPASASRHRRYDPEWRPLRLVRAEGVFVQPVGPVFGGVREPVQFLLESIGEDVLRAVPRLFFKYRAIEKQMEGMEPARAALVAERFAATTAFAHALAFCRAVEAATGLEVPVRAGAVRSALAELERLRHHARAIQAICASTGLAVPASQAAVVEEDLLRLTGVATGHRYLFGACIPGGLGRRIEDEALGLTARVARSAASRLDDIEGGLRTTSSFVDRLEEIGRVGREEALEHGLVGPLARASGVDRDLRRDHPYAAYGRLETRVPVAEEGDGFARLRVLFAEAREAARILEALSRDVPGGPMCGSAAAVSGRTAAGRLTAGGVGLGWCEAPRCASIAWVRLDGEGRVARCHLLPPSFANWHALHLATEGFAFQDFPIVLATLGLSVAECDR